MRGISISIAAILMMVPACAARAQEVPDIPENVARSIMREFDERMSDPLIYWYETADEADSAPAIRLPTDLEAREYETATREARQALAERSWQVAEQRLLTALRIQEATFGPDHGALIGTVAAFITLHAEQEHHEETIPFHRRLFQLCVANFSLNSVCTFNSQPNLTGAVSFVSRLAAEQRVDRQHPPERLGPAERRRYAELQRSVEEAVAEGDAADRSPALLARRLFEESAFGPGNLRAAMTGYDLVWMFVPTGLQHPEMDSIAASVIRVFERELASDSYLLQHAREGLAVMLMNQGRTIEAEPLIDAVLQSSRRLFGPYHPDTLHHLNSYAGALADLGRDREAEDLHREAIRSHSQAYGEDHLETLVARVRLAQFHARSGRAQEAEPVLLESWRHFQETSGPESANALFTGSSYANVLSALGRAAEAEPILRQNMETRIRLSGEDDRATPDSIMSYASVLWHLRRYPEAESHYERALRLYMNLRGPDHPRTHLANEALAAVRLKIPGRSHLALAPARELRSAVLREHEAAAIELAVDEGLENWRSGHESFFQLFADAAWASGRGLDPEAIAAGARVPDAAALEVLQTESFEALQEALVGRPSRSIAQMAARELADSADPGTGELLRRRRSIVEEWHVNERDRLDATARANEVGPDRLEAFRARRAQLETEASRIDGRLRTAFPRYAAFARPSPLSLEQARALFGPREAGLMIVPTEFGTHLMAVTDEGLFWSRSAITDEEIAELVRALRAQLDPQAPPGGEAIGPSDDPRRLRGFDRSLGHRLYSELIAPVLERLAGKTHLYIAADGALNSLPLGVLVSAPPHGEDDDPAALRSTSWLADDFALVQIPSLQSLAYLREVAAGRPAPGSQLEPYAGFGDPLPVSATSAATADSGRERPGAGLPFSRLSGSGPELELLREALEGAPQSVHLREAATERRVRSLDLSRTTVVAFATHAILGEELEGVAQSALVLSPGPSGEPDDDGLLTTSEIAELRLGADFIILSACNTAAGVNASAEGFSGLAQAFFFAGSRSLLASHWRVRDDLAARTTIGMMEHYRQSGTSRAAALQQAMRDIRNDADDPSTAHPSAWGAFSVVGEGSR
jgi:CHAT domain-containing protein